MEKKQVEQMLLWAFEEENPSDEQREIRAILEKMPARYSKVVRGRILQGEKWSRLEEKYYYSERQMRNILSEAIGLMGRKILEAISEGKISGETAWRFLN